MEKFSPYFEAAKVAERNQADSDQRIIKFFANVLGYDALRNISMKAATKGQLVDIALNVDEKVGIFVEAKAAHLDLQMGHTPFLLRLAKGP